MIYDGLIGGQDTRTHHYKLKIQDSHENQSKEGAAGRLTLNICKAILIFTRRRDVSLQGGLAVIFISFDFLVRCLISAVE